MKLSRIILIGFCLALPVVSHAADTPTTAPTTQRVPKTETAPPGFIRVTAGRYSAFCLPIDEVWVKQSLTEVKPDHMPTTRPSDIMAKIPDQRDAIAKGLAADLGIEPAKVASLFDDQIIPQLTKLENLHPPVVYLVATKPKLVALINADWTHPRISYNRLMDQIRFDDRITYSIDYPMDEILMLAAYEATDDLATRSKKLREAAEKFESESAYSIAARGRVVTQIAIAQFIEKEVFAPMKLRDDQSWLQLGTTTDLAAKYAPLLIGGDAQQLLSDLIYERPNAEPSAASIDMLNLPDLGQLLPQYRQPYINAARRKSTLAFMKLIEKGGPDAIHKALEAVRKNPPKDGPGMVALITGATGVDLTQDLRNKR